MRRAITYAGLLLALLAPSGAAANGPAPQPWTGFYVGAGGGLGSVVQVQSESIFGFGTVFSESVGAQNYFGTVAAGYDHRVMPQVVVGALFDYEISRIAIKNSDLSFFSLPFDHARTWSAGGRVGLLVNPATLLYVAGGYTRTSVEFDTIGNVDFSGYFVGGGVEAQLVGNWALRGEYRFAHYGSETLMTCFCGSLDAESSVHTGRVLVIYRFNAGTPP